MVQKIELRGSVKSTPGSEDLQWTRNVPFNAQLMLVKKGESTGTVIYSADREGTMRHNTMLGEPVLQVSIDDSCPAISFTAIPSQEGRYQSFAFLDKPELTLDNLLSTVPGLVDAAIRKYVTEEKENTDKRAADLPKEIAHKKFLLEDLIKQIAKDCQDGWADSTFELRCNSRDETRDEKWRLELEKLSVSKNLALFSRRSVEAIIDSIKSDVFPTDAVGDEATLKSWRNIILDRILVAVGYKKAW
jgi:hypothetical protein